MGKSQGSVAFDEWVATLPDKHWAKYDIAACRLGWDACSSRILAVYPNPTEQSEQLWEMKQRACRAHELCNALRLAFPEIPELGDDGTLHEAIHDILRVDTPTAAPAQTAQVDVVGHPRGPNEQRDEIELYLRDAYAAGCHAAQSRSMVTAMEYAHREAPKLRAIVKPTTEPVAQVDEVESRLAAANALLRLCAGNVSNPLVIAIQNHLQGTAEPVAQGEADMCDCDADKYNKLPHHADCAALAAQPRAVPAEASDAELMAEWFKADGSVHGPNVETVTMPQAKYLAFRRSLAKPAERVVDGLTADVLGGWCNLLTHAWMYVQEGGKHNAWLCIEQIEKEMRDWQRKLAAAP